ncbi:MAG: Disulfide-bond oxidoreductase YfcG [Gammaproteobacteria bacterium]|nr:Disulfide-bond oxidoreductase YfcG [Gammaproteobacteria bacterium]
MYKVLGTSHSGNSYKVKLLLSQLQIPHTWQETDILQGATRTPEFLAMNPNGKVPLLQVGPGRYLPESNAILCYLADGSPLWPADRWGRADTLRWMFFEQYSHEPYIAVARFIMKFLPPDHSRRAEVPGLYDRGYKALGVMEQRLSAHPYFVGDAYSIADIALFAYTHVAADGGFALERYPAVTAWIERVAAQPRFIPLETH